VEGDIVMSSLLTKASNALHTLVIKENFFVKTASIGISTTMLVFCQDLKIVCEKTRYPGLPFIIDCLTMHYLAVLIQYTNVADRQTYRRTDARLDIIYGTNAW